MMHPPKPPHSRPTSGALPRLSRTLPGSHRPKGRSARPKLPCIPGNTLDTFSPHSAGTGGTVPVLPAIPPPREHEAGAEKEKWQVKSEALEPQGFDKLQRTLGWVVARVERSRKERGGESLNAAWDEVAYWLERYFDNKEIAVTSQRLCALRSSLEESSDLSQPNNQQAYLACMGLDHLLRSAVRAHPPLTELAGTVRSDLHAAIFCSKAPVAPAPLTVELAFSPEALIAPFQGRRTYFQACGVLSQRLTGERKDRAHAGEMYSKAAGGVERVVKYWKRHVCGVILRGWRAHVKHAREQNAARELRFELQRVQSQLTQERNEAKRRVAAAELRRKRAEEQHAKLRHETDTVSHGAILERNKCVKLQQEVAELQAQLREVRRDAEEYRRVSQFKYIQVVDALRETGVFVAGPPFERVNRKRFGGLLGQDKTHMRSLIDWVNLCTKHVLDTRKVDGAPSEKDVTLRDFSGGPEVLKAYWCVLAAVSPGHVSDSELAQGLKGKDFGQVAQSLLDKLNELEIRAPVQREDLLGLAGDSLSEQHELLVASIFSRFCDRPLGSNVVFQEAESHIKAEREKKLEAERVRQSSGCWEDVLDLEDDEPEEPPPPEPEEVISELHRNMRTSTAWSRFGTVVRDTTLARAADLIRKGGSLALTPEEQRQQTEYTEIEPAIIKTLLSTDDGSEDEDEERVAETVEREVADCGSILFTKYKKLRKIYIHYAGNDNVSMTNEEFWCLLSDARLIEKGFSREALQKAVAAALQQTESLSSVEDALPPRRWVAVLVSLSAARFKKTEGSIADKLIQLLEKHLLLFCCHAEAEQFRSQVYVGAVQEILSKNRAKLKKVFKHYGSAPESGGFFVKDATEMQQTEFIRMTQEVGALDAALTNHALDGVLKSRASVGEGGPLMFHEYLELICAVVAFKYPNPFIPLHQKLSRFLDTVLFPPLARKLKFAATT
eukprot:Hpha_TRINITY_DN22455_c0_g1::TRINITY_DN22455_c0_g1_i1::g.94931::m.94931